MCDTGTIFLAYTFAEKPLNIIDLNEFLNERYMCALSVDRYGSAERYFKALATVLAPVRYGQYRNINMPFWAALKDLPLHRESYSVVGGYDHITVIKMLGGSTLKKSDFSIFLFDDQDGIRMSKTAYPDTWFETDRYLSGNAVIFYMQIKQ